MNSSFAESLARGATRDDDSFMGALARGYGLAGILDDITKRSHERDVNGRIDEILAASNGGQTDLSTLDPKLISDRVGMEAMGKVSQQLSQTGEWQNKIFNNGVQQAKNLYGIAQGYLTDFNDAVKSGDSQRAMAIYGNMANRMNLPYRFVQEGDGFRMYHITPEGEQDMGNVSLTDLYKRTADALNNEQMFIKGSAAYNMTNWEINQKYMSDPSKWRYGVTRDGKQLAMVPQTFQRNGQMVPGFYVEGLGNRTLDELAAANISVGGLRGGLRSTGGGRGGRGRGTSGGGDQSQPGLSPNGEIRIPEKVMKDLDRYAKENSKDKETGHDAEHISFFKNMYAYAMNISRATKGKVISPDEFMAFMQSQRKEFDSEYADQTEGMTGKQKNELFRAWYAQKLRDGETKLQTMKQGKQDATGAKPKPESSTQAKPKATPRVDLAGIADGTVKPPSRQSNVRLVTPEEMEDMPN